MADGTDVFVFRLQDPALLTGAFAMIKWFSRFTRRILLFAVSVLSVTACYAQDPNDTVTNTALATIIKAVYGVALLPSGYLKIQMADGSTKQVKTAGFTRYQIPTGWIFVTGLELVEDTDAVATDVLNFTTRLNGAAPTYIVAFYTDPSGVVTAYRSGILDAKSPVTSLDSIYFPEPPTDGSWPIIRTISWSGYESTDWTGGIRWETQIDTSTMTVIAKVPTAIKKVKKDGTSSFSLFDASRVDPNTIALQDQQTQYLYACTDPCIVDGPTLMALWQGVN